MEVDYEKLLDSLKLLKSERKNTKVFDQFLRLNSFTSNHIDEIVLLLSQLIVDPSYTELIGKHFTNILLLTVTKFLSPNENKEENFETHQRKCVALSKLVKYCPDVLKYSFQFFGTSRAPFARDEYTPKRKQFKSDEKSVCDLEIVQSCLNFLRSDQPFYKNVWSWSDFIEMYFNKGCNLQKLYCNYIVAIITNMTQSQLNVLNRNIPKEIIINDQIKLEDDLNIQDVEINAKTSTKIVWDFKSDIVTNIGDVTLPIFNAENSQFYHSNNGIYENLVIVDSTKLNIRSLAMGVSSGKAICLSGPVGCGKTSLVEYLARKTGRIAPKMKEIENKQKDVKKKCEKSKKRKVNGVEKEASENGFEIDMEMVEKYAPKNGFLRIQLGDQTDSKMLLGQYRCTDTPGEFVWQPGVLTQAVMNGFWLLLEDLDSATQDVCTVLTNLLENNYLSVPGFRDCLRIEPGFQLFFTLRTHKASNPSLYNTYTLLEKYLYTVNILPSSRKELSEIICENYPKLKTVATRIVDIYLIFSSGCHSTENDEHKENIDILEDSVQKKENYLDSINGTEDDVLPSFKHNDLSLFSLPNSGRLVSTRDLMKLCRRSDPSFSVTSTECAYFVFQNAVDIFCSHLPQGDIKNNLVASIGGKIGIIKSRCDHINEDYKPSVDVSNAKQIKIGRVELERNLGVSIASDDEFVHKKIKLDQDAVVKTHEFNIKNKAPTFSFTRLASCLLERIAVSVSQNEPILLVGETGVGKTSSIQYLAFQTHHKLVVVNMNNQSDVSDLIGGFKPVDLSYVVTPLRYEFEFLFNKTFNASKNEKFLTNLSVCFNRGEFNVLVKLMLKIIEKVFLKKKDENLKAENVYEKWETLQTKLTKLDSQLKNSINVSFAFIPGSLVNCIKNGDWVLLDEINLASTETLECLSTILEPDGSIILLEKGDFVPVKRHPDFRIFSCMNPNTDVGKKDLPVGIRNRFTEFFVDELLTENDLLILVNDYLSNTGIQKVRIMNTVKLYRRLRVLAQLELNDGLGNRPVYSLRTLCRALNICAKNLCGSIERNLYESFCLSFLTQLDLKSHAMVLKFIQKTMLNDVKQAMSQPIPKPANGEQLNFEGYWIEQGPKEVQECENYILTESVKNNLRDLARIISIGKLPVLLQGPTSAGKTSLIEYIGRKSGNVCLRINNHEHTDLQEYIGTYVADVTGKLSFKEGVLVQAMRNGHWIILDELNLAPSDILEALNRVLDDNRELFIPETQVVVKAHPNFMLFATQNPPGLYGGRKMLSRAFKNRFIELHFSEIPKNELEVILEKRCLIPKSLSQKMVKTMSDLQQNRRSTSKNTFTLRDLFRWGNRYTFANKKLQEDQLYDWNQHLIDEGYLVLSAKVRNNFETKIIENALYTHFRKRISEENLFSLHEKTSKVTKEILEQLMAQTYFASIVWTFDMRRMAVLTAKSLEFDEPILLVGPTGCGKTTICQILAGIQAKNLRILNCHMHTEGADFLGGLRPYREGDNADENKSESKQLFEWSDGPLILSMMEGGFFLADEISLAEDSVLERLNCVLEPERTLLLAEKGGVDSDSSEFVITANEGFQFLATMNPGGDFGKKELSPALRNRLTEIWCRPTDSQEDLIRIAEHAIKLGIVTNAHLVEINKIAQIIIKTVFFMKGRIEKLNFSIRDVLAWVAFIIKNHENLSLPESFVYGLETVFLDALEMLPYETFDEIVILRRDILECLQSLLKEILNVTIDYEFFYQNKGNSVSLSDGKFGIQPFFIDLNPLKVDKKSDFMFSAPTTQKNLFRLLSALSLDKAILLEGPPGVGKTSLVENLSLAVGYNIVRINLCEHTDLADLFGTDLPADNETLETGESVQEDRESKLGSFIWRDGPLLAALKARNTWILLDELNLAPQSVLEGLNAILDHRGEVFISELNKTFKLGKKTRIFAAQNPLRQGGGRKGLPQSFLNRFTKVYLQKLERRDLLHVVESKYKNIFESIGAALVENLSTENSEKSEEISFFSTSNKSKNAVKFDLAEKMVIFSEALENGITNLEFGYKGGPFEANLRDILRWCELFTSKETGYYLKYPQNLKKSSENFYLVLFEKMKLVYYQRMRTDVDKNYILNAFSDTFQCDAHELDEKSKNIGVFWTDDKLYLGDIMLEKLSKNISQEMNPVMSRTQKTFPLILASQVETFKNLTECVLMEKPVILCGPNDSGKTKTINLLCTLSNKFCNVDTIDDSVTGSFQQFDFNRHLEDVSATIESVLINVLKTIILGAKDVQKEKKSVINLLAFWEKYSQLNDGKLTFATTNALSEELILFRKRVNSLHDVITSLESYTNIEEKANLKNMKNILITLNNISKYSETLNTGGHFEWVDSKIVKSLKSGQYICLEHVNLCSSAILDRLNPIFEPNGNLLISEKGVNSNNEAELIEKHKNFRAFLTLDPKNGEISRAMRNRCIELSLHRESYSDDDLKKIIFENGVQQIYLITAILTIHQKLKTVSEFNTFGISNIIKFSFLVSQNKRMGLDDRKSLLISALEVYVRSSNTDLLGYGIAYYRNALREVIVEEIKSIKKIGNVINYENIILKSNDLTTLRIIKLQCEPFSTIIKCLMDPTLSITTVLSNISHGFNRIEIDSDILKYLFNFLYEISSFSDVQQRHIYIKTILKSMQRVDKVEMKEKVVENKIVIDMKLKEEKGNQWDNKSNIAEYETIERKVIKTDEVSEEESFDIDQTLIELLKLNDQMAIDVKNRSTSQDIPWNTKLFPRIRDYEDLESTDHYKLSCLLMLRTILKRVEIKNTTKLSQIDLISYSKAVSKKIISDSLNNELIAGLYELLSGFESYIEHILDKIDLQDEEYVRVIGSYLWMNRFVQISQGKLFVNKSINDKLLDYIMLHFKWINKHCFKVIDDNLANHSDESDYKLFLDKLRNAVLNTSHPLNIYRKVYFKNFTNFLPFYDSNQINYYDKNNEFDDGLRLLPKLGSVFELEDYHDRVKAMNHSKTNDFKRMVVVNTAELSDNFHVSNASEITSSQVIEDEDFNVIMMLLNEFPNNSIDLDEKYKMILEKFDRFNAEPINYENLSVKTNKFDTEILPILEYFVIKSSMLIYSGQTSKYSVNTDFVNDVKSLNLNFLKMIKNIDSEKYVKIEKVSNLVDKIISSNNVDFDVFISQLPVGFYKNHATYIRVLREKLQTFILSSLCINNSICYHIDDEDEYLSDIDTNVSINAPILTNNYLSIILAKSGELRATGLGELPEWKKTLKSLKNLLWNNVNVIRKDLDIQSSNLHSSTNYAAKLLVEIEHVKKLCEIQEKDAQTNDSTEFNTEFQNLIDLLKEFHQLAITPTTESSTKNRKNQQWYVLSMINSLVGTIELNLLTYMPLLDPVEKNTLKKKYVEEDMKHFKNLIISYEFMAVTMNYKHLGDETKELFANHVKKLDSKQEKLCKKAALRPDDNIYTNLVKDVNHFLIACCHPNAIANLLSNIKECLDYEIDTQNMSNNINLTKSNLQKINETIKRIELWISNSQKFEHHTLPKYSTYYRDFLGPINCSITMLKYGLTGLKHCLMMARDSIGLKRNGVYYDLNENNALTKIMEKFVQFPSFKDIDLFGEIEGETKTKHKVNIYSVMEKIDHSESYYFRLLKSKLQEIQNGITISKGIDAENFVDLDKIINVCNQMWQKQEHARRKKQEEDDSLYLTKSHCEEEDEEIVAQREIVDMFPNYVDEDFSDFIQNDTLEQVIKVENVRKTKKLSDTIMSEDYKLICETFIYVMGKYSRSFYYNGDVMAALTPTIELDFINPYQTKTTIFYKVLQKYKTCLNTQIDETFYPGLNFLVGLAQDYYDDMELKTFAVKQNFYKDSNISEVVQCVEVLKRVESRVLGLLAEWPDHAVLKDIINILDRIYRLPSTAPIVRFSTGLQLLRKKIDEWNSVAHKLNNLRELELDIVEFVHRWMRMELQFWRECMSETHDSVRSKAYRYWFFMYNLLHEYLQSDSKAKLGNLLDYRKVEKCFGEDEIVDDEPVTEENKDETVKITDVIHVLKQFMESSNYAEYTTRLRVLKSFEQYLIYLKTEDNKKRDTLIAVLYNLHMYYDQFSAEIEEFIKLKRTPIEKNLKDFVKIESFNKDLSYFSMKHNIARVHRHLHKFLKEFETEIKTRVLSVFSPKEAGTEINAFQDDKKKKIVAEPNVTQYTVDVKNFIAATKLKEKYSVKSVEGDSELLGRIDKLFSTSRNIVREAVLHAPYPGLIFNLDVMVYNQIETCEYLRHAEVDRSLTKPKQKAQAKHILNQKRKALSDFYKSLTTLGLSYKSGLVEHAINQNHVDLTIKPFSIDLLTRESPSSRLNHHITALNENLNLYYSKCIFKFKMLIKIMLLPNSELGMINIERIKGFSIDLFLLVQKQRKLLGKSISNVFELRDKIRSVVDLNECLENEEQNYNFDYLKNKVKVIKKCAAKTRSVLEQFELLLKCVPENNHEELAVLKLSNEAIFSQNSIMFGQLKNLTRNTLKQSITLIDKVKETDAKYLTFDHITNIERLFVKMQKSLEDLKSCFQMRDDDEYFVIAKSIIDLSKYLQTQMNSVNPGTTDNSVDSIDQENVNTELENIIHSILLSMQNIYKKYTNVEEPTAQEEPKEEDKKAEEEEDDSNLEQQHLKEKIERDLLSDLLTLNIRKIITKVNNVLTVVNTNSCLSKPIIEKFTRLIPILEQYNLMIEYYLIQQLGAHKVSTKMLSIMLTVFIELGTKGFCIPKDLLDEEQDGKQEGDENGQGFGFEDGEGEKDVSDKIESEDQLDDARKPGQEDKNDKDEKDNKEEKGIDMSEDFESKLQDLDKQDEEDSDDDKSEDEEDPDKQMGETEEGAEKLDEQIWGDDEEKENEEEEKEEDMNEEDGKGASEGDEQHNNLDSEKDQAPGNEEEGLDAVDKGTDKSKKEKPKDIEDMNNEEGEEEQDNPHHNELEEPPQPENMDLEDDVNLDNGEENDKDRDENQENPFDIDNMKDGEEPEDKKEEGEDEKAEEGDKQDIEDSSDEEENPEGADKVDETKEPEPEPEVDDKKDENEEVQQQPDAMTEEEQKNEEENKENEEKKNAADEDNHESKDKRSEEEKVESMPDTQNKGTNDQFANDKEESKQENEMDEQDTGEDKEGVGQAENDKSESGHQGITESKETQTNRNKNDEKEKQEKRKKGNTDEDRVLGDAEKAEEKRLKTIEKINKERPEQEEKEEDKDAPNESEEYQHVKEAKKTDKTTLDNATEEQSKQVQHEENADKEDKEGEEGADELMEVDEDEAKLEDIENPEIMESEKNENKKEKSTKMDENQEKKGEKNENVEVEGEKIETAHVQRGEDTTAHTMMDILNDMTLPEEPTVAESLELRKMVELESTTTRVVMPEHEDFESWQQISNKMMPNARELCEQLRLILEPTKCTRLKGDYRTGRRINMKKIIPYIASQFRKDKIWLRRTKAAQRDYKITIAVDDSKSMDHNNSKALTLQAISLVSQALKLLESGRLSVLSFGEQPKILLNHMDQFDGAKLVNSLNFDQNQSRIAELLDFTRTSNAEDGSSADNGIFENLLIVLSDGRNIFSEGEKKVKNSVKLARLQRIFIVYVIIDNPENKHSIMDIRVPIFSQDRNEITMHSYLDTFPFPYYVIVRDLGQLPLVLSDAMRQWFELVNSEQ